MVNEGKIKLHIVANQWFFRFAEKLNNPTEAKLKLEKGFHLFLLVNFGLRLFLCTLLLGESLLVIRIFCDLLFWVNFFNIIITETKHGFIRHDGSSFTTELRVPSHFAIGLIAATHRALVIDDLFASQEVDLLEGFRLFDDNLSILAVEFAVNTCVHVYLSNFPAKLLFERIAVNLEQQSLSTVGIVDVLFDLHQHLLQLSLVSLTENGVRSHSFKTLVHFSFAQFAEISFLRVSAERNSFVKKLVEVKIVGSQETDGVRLNLTK